MRILKITLTVCWLIFKMADDRRSRRRFEFSYFPVTASQFSATFLNFQRNSRGYEKEIACADLDAAKRLLNPFPSIVEGSIPQCHRFGNVMWTFAKEGTATQSPSKGQCTGFNPQKCHLSSEEELKVTPSKEELSHSSFPHFVSEDDEPTHKANKTLKPNSQLFVNETEPLKSDFSDAAGLHEGLNIKVNSNGTDQNQNTVISKFSSSQNEGHHFQDCSDQKSNRTEFCEVDSRLSSTEAVHKSGDNVKSLYFENHTETANIYETEAKLSTSCNPQGIYPQSSFQSNVGVGGRENRDYDVSYGDDDNDDDGYDDGDDNNDDDGDDDGDECIKNKKELESKESMRSVYSINRVEYKDIPEDHNAEKQKTLKELLCLKHPITPLPLYKQRNYNGIPISTSLTVNLNSDALLSVLRGKQKNAKIAEHGVDWGIYGKIAILYGFQQNSTISVVKSEVVGLYDYISGSLYNLHQGFDQEESESQDMKFPLSSHAVALDLEVFLAQFHHTIIASSPETTNGGKSLKEHYPVAWLLTSPALGVTLDWQVQEKLVKFLETLSTYEFNVEQESASNNFNDGCISTQWYNLFVVIDEYRNVEKDISLVEVYEIRTNEKIKVVNYDLN